MKDEKDLPPDFGFSLWVKIEAILRDLNRGKGFMINYSISDGAMTTGIHTHHQIKLVLEKIFQELPQSC